MAGHLYFHIPFCAKLCPYCSFYVDTAFKNKNRRFLDALLREVESTLPLQPETVYFGGGTPSALSLSELEYLLSRLGQLLDLSALQEWTFEVNPATVSVEKARLLKSFGVNRISLGVQSWEESVLKTLGRIHDAAQCHKTYELLRNAGFSNINIDLMFAVPGQTIEQWLRTLAKTVALRPEHVSAYCLTYEEDTDFFRRLTGGQFQQNDEWDADLFEATMNTLMDAGLEHYEISNYASPGRRSAHNAAYWNGADYLGFGPSAFSTLGGAHGARRWQNIANTVEYTERLLAGHSVLGFEETLDQKMRTGEVLAFQIRTSEGIDGAAAAPWLDELHDFFELGLIERHMGRILLTTKGKLLADAVAEVFV